MANEINSNISMSSRKNGAVVSISSAFRLDMTGDEMINATQSIGTTAETVGFGDITGAPGVAIIKNLDDTNFIELGGDSGLTVFKTKVLPGQFTQIQPTSATLYAKADTAAVRIQIVATEA